MLMPAWWWGHWDAQDRHSCAYPRSNIFLQGDKKQKEQNKNIREKTALKISFSIEAEVLPFTEECKIEITLKWSFLFSPHKCSESAWHFEKPPALPTVNKGATLKADSLLNCNLWGSKFNTERSMWVNCHQWGTSDVLLWTLRAGFFSI